MGLTILIVEDEKLTAEDLKSTLLSIEPDATILPFIGNVEDGVAFFETDYNVDLIFSDIELGDGKSFDIYERFELNTPIIFCTAYNEFALKAFETTGIDYVLKPFSKESIQKALGKFKNLSIQKSSNPTTDLSELLQVFKKEIGTSTLPSIILYQGDKIIPVKGETIAAFYIEHDTVKAITFDNKKLYTNYKLEDLERKFSPPFFRANRQYLIHKNAVKEANQHFHRKLSVQLTVQHEAEILIGKEKVTAFLNWLSN